MFAFLAELYVCAWLGCGPVEEDLRNDSVFVVRVFVEAIVVVLFVCTCSGKCHEEGQVCLWCSRAVVFLHVFKTSSV